MAVKAKSITLKDLMDVSTKEGNFLQSKKLFISSADAWGALLKDLITALGIDRAKRFLFRYGYQCGKHEALMLRDMFEWENKKEWILAGVTMHNLSGRSSSRPSKNIINTETGEFDVQGYWYNSYEANQYLQHFPIHNESICNFLQGYASGYCGTSLGKKVFFKEVECIGKGDAHCRYVGKTLELWGDDIPWNVVDYAQEDIGNELDLAYKRIENQSKILERINTLNNQLTQIVLQGKGLNEIAQILGKSLACGVVISNQYFEPLAEYGQIRNYSLKEMINNISKLHLLDRKKMDRMLNDRATITLNSIENLGFPSYLMITPIVAQKNKFGYISIISDSHEFKAHESPFIERTANICALQILNEKTVTETKHRMKEELLNEILLQPNQDSTVAKRLSYLGYNLNEPHYVFIFRLQSPCKDESFALQKEQIGNILRTHSSHTEQKMLVSNQFGQVYALIPEELIKFRGIGVSKYGQTILKAVKQKIPNSQIAIGISNLCSGIVSFHQGFKQAEKALDIARINDQKEQVVLFSNLGYLSILLDARKPEELEAYAEGILGPILEYDIRKSTELLKTLYFYINNECNLHKTARQMSLSIGGMRYRLSSITERFNIDMTNSSTRREVQLALDIYLSIGKLTSI